MPKLLRLTFDNVGHPSARLDGLDIATSKDGNPLSTVLWLRNGGGKSSIISLLCSIFVPGLREFTAKGEGRTLEGYVGSKGVSIVMSEWTTVGEPNRRRRVVGVAMAQRGEEGGGLRRIFFSFLTGGDRSLFGDETDPMREFPMRANGVKVRGLAEFSNWLRRVQRDFPTHDVIHTDHQGEWHRLLGNRRFEERDFRLIASMNRKEGLESEGVLRLRNAGEFVNFVIENVHNPESFGLLRDGIVAARLTVSEKGAILARIEFSDEVIPLLRDVGETYGVQAKSVAVRDGVMKEAHAAASALGMTWGQARLRSETLKLAAVQSEEAAALARADTFRATVSAQTLSLRAGMAEVEMFTLTAQNNRTEATVKRNHMNAANAAESLSAWRLAQAERDTALKQRDAALLPWQDLRERLDCARVELGKALDEKSARMRTASEERSRESEKHEAEAKAFSSAASTLHREEATARGEARTAREAAERRDRRLAEMQADNVVKSGEDVSDALARWRSTAEEAGLSAEKWRKESAEVGDKRAFLNQKASEARQGAFSERRRADEALRDIATYDGRRTDLMSMPAAALMGDGGVPSPPDESGLSERTERAAARAREDAARRRKEVEPLMCMREHIEKNFGLLPLSPDAGKVMDWLRDMGLNAHQYARYLAETGESPEAVAALLAADPARYSGVVVVGNDDSVRTRLWKLWESPHPLASPVQIISASAPSRGGDSHRVVGIHPASFSRDAARDVVEEALRREEETDALALADEARALLLEGFARVLHGFNGTYPANWRELREAEAAAFGKRADELALEASSTTEAVEAAAEARRLAEKLFVEARSESAAANTAAVDCATFLDVHTKISEVLLAHATNLEAKADLVASESARQESLAGEARTKATTARTDARDALAEAKRLLTEAQSLGERTTATGEVPDLVTARVAYEALVRESEGATDDLALKERVESTVKACERAEKAYATLERRYGLVLAEVEFWLEVPPGAVERAIDEVNAADETLRAAESALAKVEAELNASRAGFHTDACREADVLGSVELPDEARKEANMLFDEARAHADEAEAQDKESRTSTTLSTKMDGIVSTLFAVVDSLPDWAKASAESGKTEAAILEKETSGEVNTDDVLRQWKEASRLVREAEADAYVAGRRARAAISILARCVRSPKGRLGAAAMMDDLSKSIDEGRITEEAEEAILAAMQMGDYGRTRLSEADAAIDGLVSDLDVQVREIRSSLNRLAKASTIPDDPSMGAWSGKPFVDVKLDGGDDAAERAAALRILLSDLCGGGADLPSPVNLAIMSFRKILRNDPHVTMLKPGMAMDARRHPVTEVLAASGGEKLTAAVLIYAALRRLVGGISTSQAGGSMLLLDNPIGPCNLVELLNLQRKVAEACNVQLVFTTGLNDYESVRVFPLVVALKNEAVSASGQRLVEMDEESSTSIEMSRVEFRNANW